jgi:hypothetical protein
MMTKEDLIKGVPALYSFLYDRVVFHSNEAINGDGFQLEWRLGSF